MIQHTRAVPPQPPAEPWYKYGVAVLFLEMALALAVSAYSLYLTFNGIGGFPGRH